MAVMDSAWTCDHARSAIALVLSALSLTAGSALVDGQSPGSSGGACEATLTEDGAWSWFSDPRALCIDGRIVACWVRSDGTLQVGELSRDGRSTAIADLATGLAPDDHNCPALLETSDGRLTAFFAGHAEPGGHVMTRTTVEPGSIEEWGECASIMTNTRGAGGATYANPIPIPGSEDRAYVFWRGGNWKPTISTGQYSPETASWTWSEARTFIAAPGGRPYAKYRPFDPESMGVAFTDGHPRDTDNNVYFALIEPDSLGELRLCSGGESPQDSLPDGVLSTSTAEVVYDRRGSPDGADSWVWDVAFTPDGRPVVVYVTFQSRASHRYHWACRSDSVWTDHVLLDDAGSSFADTTIHYPQYYYSGGMALDPNDPRIVYLSRQNSVGGWDIERWATPDDGLTWVSVPITSGETVDNVRPVVPWGCPPGKQVVLWMSGRYDFYKSPLRASRPDGEALRRFHTAIRVWSATSAMPTP